MKKAIGLALAVLATTVVAASAQGSNKIAAASAAGVNCKSTITLPFVTPVTGGAGFLGAEQGSWAKYAVKTLRADARPEGQVRRCGDTPVEQGPAPAQTLAQKYVADKSVLVVLGPSTSGAVAASTRPTSRRRSRTSRRRQRAPTLTQGSPKEATPAFFRDVPGDYIQGPSDANFMITSCT